MIMAVQPPAYFASVKECAKLLTAEVVVEAESFRFSRKESIHRAAIRTRTGVHWLSVPVLSRGKPGARIDELEIDPRQPWGDLHLRTLEYTYHNAAWYYFYSDAVSGIIRGAGSSLATLLRATGRFAVRSLQATATCFSSTELPAVADRTGRVLAWAAACGCNCYLVWPFEVALLDRARLRDAGITLLQLEFGAAPYHQQMPDFQPGLSILDLLFNEGPAAADHIRKSVEYRVVDT
ncbi:MAG TPA: WbqC family protein [bacterium]|nr:WbqC family protein [bacterium]HQI47343.1 WbqC family protein [bacterium]HQJ63382.1 WbqC family protein [bacterium]